MVIPVIFFVLAWTYALAVNFVPSYRDPADRIGDSDGIERKEEEQSMWRRGAWKRRKK